jgi:ClpP class serine protease
MNLLQLGQTEWAIHEPALHAFAEQLKQQQSTLISPSLAEAEAASAFEVSKGDEDANRILHINGETAVLRIRGILLQSVPAWMSRWGLSVTGYDEIIDAISRAENDDSVKQIILNIDSPGGVVTGHHRVSAAIRAAKKRVIAFVPDWATSAAYGIAAQADELIAGDIQTTLGSVGVVVTMWKFDEQFTITSTLAPKKAPNPATEEGQKLIQERLDKFHTIFVGDIAAGRGKEPATVNSDFGNGDLVLAEAALAAGMIDKIEELDDADGGNSSDNNARASTRSGVKVEARMKTLADLRAEHPALLAEAEGAARKEGHTAGSAEERSRVTALVILGKANGAMDMAIEAIEKGTDSRDPVLDANFRTAGTNKGDVEARGKATEKADPGTAATAESATVESDIDTKVNTALAEELGHNQEDAK